MNSAIFLSASVPVPGRGNFYEDADPFLIHIAVRELITTVLGRHTIIWGGHPAITPMIWAVCEDLGVNYSDTVVLYQSKFFEEMYPEENSHFNNVEYIDAVNNNRGESLRAMRHAMLARCDIKGAVFIGGMEGIFEEWELFQEYHQGKPIIAVGATGGASRMLAQDIGEPQLDQLDFVTLFHDRLEIPFNAPRFTKAPNSKPRL